MVTYKCNTCRTRECILSESIGGGSHVVGYLACPLRFNTDEWKLVEDNTGKVGYPIEDKKELPAWVKNGACAYHEEYGYIRLSAIGYTESEAHIVATRESINVDNEGFFNGRIVEAKYRPFTDDELRSLVGKTVATINGNISLVTDYNDGNVFIYGEWFDSATLAESKWEFNGEPCHVLDIVTAKEDK